MSLINTKKHVYGSILFIGFLLVIFINVCSAGLNTFKNGEVADAAKVNQNFTTLDNKISANKTELDDKIKTNSDNVTIIKADIESLKKYDTSNNTNISNINTNISNIIDRLKILEAEKPRCRVFLSSEKVHSLHDNTWAKLVWDEKDYNIGNCWNENKKEQFVAPSTGLYSLQGLLVTKNTGNDYTYINVYYQYGNNGKKYLGYWSSDGNTKDHVEWITISLQHYMEKDGFIVFEVKSSERYYGFQGGTPGQEHKSVSFMTFAKIQ